MSAPHHDHDTRAALERALGLHRAGRLDEAEPLYRAVLARHPSNPDALHFLGLVAHQRGELAAAIELLARAIAADPGYVDAHNNLGNLLRIAGRHAEAEAAYRRVIELRDGDANSHCNLALVLKGRGDLEGAEAMLRRAIVLDDHHVAALTNLGHLLSRTGRVKESLGYYAAATAFDPGNPDAPRVLGLAYQATGQIDKALEVFRGWVERDPGNPVAEHMLRACAGGEPPRRASDAFVRKVFDGMAEGFDEHLADLSYRAPQLVARAFERAWPAANGALDVLDAGCGTGLCAQFLRPHARSLVGVDLSSGMLHRAARLRLYDRLVEDELTRFLLSQPRAWDAIVSADTLCYFGALDAVLDAVAAALRPGGRVIFTVEHAAQEPPGGYRLESHGRYSHARSYVEGQLERAGLAMEGIEQAELRMENSRPVAGLVASARAARV